VRVDPPLTERIDTGTLDAPVLLARLISLLALPSLCRGQSPGAILELGLGALAAVVPFELGHLRLFPEGLDATRATEPLGPDEVNRLRHVLEPHLRMPVPTPGTRIENLPRLGEGRLLVVPLGFYGEAGMLAVASHRPDFPSSVEATLVHAGASMLSAAIENARAQARAEDARREAEAANRAKDEFLAMLGHELRNPLAPIVTALELMKMDPEGRVTPEREIIERQVLHLRRMVDDLLDVSRIARGVLELARKRIELSAVLQEALEMTSPLLEQRRHLLEVRCPGDGLPVEVDPGRCAQLVANLISNAAKYTEPGGRIGVAAERQGTWAELRVTDSGMGIAQEMLSRIFDPFVQEGRALDRAQGGLGLGLAIARSLAMLHGGTVEARSPGHTLGSEFIVRLPLATREPAQIGPTTTAPETSARRETILVRRILIVDDNRDAAQTLSELVEVWGYAVAVAFDPAEALQRAREFHPELVLLDIGLPVMNGYELAERLRGIPGLEKVLIAAITGYGQDGDRTRAKRAGIDAHLVKPVDGRRLREVLGELLPERQSLVSGGFAGT
jgi:signal transduction histidine kinase/ActR/RegA family two-component response regulator